MSCHLGDTQANHPAHAPTSPDPSLYSIPILVNAALLFIVTNCTCGWSVLYLLAEPAVFALILWVVRLPPDVWKRLTTLLLEGVEPYPNAS